jgi:Ca2+-binding EF-hand superfamily protein
VQQAFNAVDVDGSGFLDRDEIRVLLENLGKRPTEADIDCAMAELDVDNSGEVDFEEFSGT